MTPAVHEGRFQTRSKANYGRLSENRHFSIEENYQLRYK